MKREIFISALAGTASVLLLIAALDRLIQVPELEICHVETEPIPIEKEAAELVGEVVLESKTVEAVIGIVPGEIQSINGTDDDLLAKIAKLEAGNQDVIGKALVVRVVMNRVENPEFPDSVKAVIYEENQFSPVRSGDFESAIPDRECLEAVKMVMSDGWDESQGALYFESESKSTWHRENLKYLFEYGEHYFYTHREAEN